MSDSGFTSIQIMHLHIKFHKLHLTQGSSYFRYQQLIVKEKAVINPKKC